MMTSRTPNPSAKDNLRTLSKILLIAFLLVAAALFFWSMIRARSLLSRDDNPRLVEAEQGIRRGTIFDRNDLILAQNIGPQERQERYYPFPDIGPAVGYSSLTYGTTGAESAFDTTLRGESRNPAQAYWQQVLHLPQIGHDVQLALDSGLQETAHSLLGKRDGAVLLLEMTKDGSQRAWIRALSSSPSYDPNVIDDQFEKLGANEKAPLLNRVTQGQYQPGLLLQPLILAAAVERGIIQLSDPVINPQRPVDINGKSIGCASQPPDPSSWAGVLLHQCPGPMQDLADQLGSGGLDSVFAAFELDQDPVLEIETTTTADEPLSDPLLAGIGQDNLSITPLKIGLAMAVLVGQGSIPQPFLAAAIMDEEGEWQKQDHEYAKNEIISPVASQEIRQTLSEHEDIREFTTLVISGPEGSTNSWYIGLKTAEWADQVVVVVLEGSGEKSIVQDIGRGVISANN